jgi:hypothetical protein
MRYMYNYAYSACMLSFIQSTHQVWYVLFQILGEFANIPCILQLCQIDPKPKGKLFKSIKKNTIRIRGLDGPEKSIVSFRHFRFFSEDSTRYRNFIQL